ncbi:galactosylceramide sulfotransferase-like [Branchiostoma lanceolatum]|uniref:galactosylceramide sulfotransferase-like n=1 Tax=Branchiostoma lanceolatum TaxID=7740 RepID=UPI0034512654
MMPHKLGLTATSYSHVYILACLLAYVGFSCFFATMYTDGTSLSVRTPLHKMPNRRFSREHGEEVCDIKQNFMFVKVHKAGGTTTTCIFQRFGYEHNLTFVLPVVKTDVGWPNFLKPEDFIPSADGTYNVLVDHTVYHRQLLDHLMPPDTVYISILRHPLAQLRSVFNWYGLAIDFHGLEGPDPVASFLENPKKFQIPFAIAKHTPHTLAQNLMAYDLGFPLGLSDDQSFVDEFIQKMSREIDLVLILEHYAESLVLLRRMMCWTLKDILYDVVPKNGRRYQKPTTNTTLIQMHRQWSNVDYQLFDYFNATLWRKIQQEDQDFHQEVRHFEKVLQSTTTYCTNAIIKLPVITKTVNATETINGTFSGTTNERNKKAVLTWGVNETAGILTIPRTAWQDEFDVDPSLCLKLKMEWLDWAHVLKAKHKMPANFSAADIKYPKRKTLENLMMKMFHID